MIYALTPSGNIIQFERASYQERFSEYTSLWTYKDGEFIARVPKEWCISHEIPIGVGETAMNTLTSSLMIVAKYMRSAKSRTQLSFISELKSDLKDFDSRQKTWK